MTNTHSIKFIIFLLLKIIKHYYFSLSLIYNFKKIYTSFYYLFLLYTVRF